MNTEQKKALLADARNASHALGRVLDGGHDLSQLTTLSNSCLNTMCGLSILDARLESEIGTDNL